MNPRIGIIHYSYPPIIGGVETIVKQQAHLFSDHKFPVTVLVGEGASDRKDIKLIEISEIKSLRNINNKLYQDILDQKEFPEDFYKYSEDIYKKLDEHLKELDLLIVHNMLTLKFNLPFNHAFRRYVEANPNKKYIAWTHDVTLNQGTQKHIFINDQIENLVYKPFPNVYYIGISHFLKDTLENLVGFPKNFVQVIPNAVHIQEFLNLDGQTKKLITKHRLLEADPLIFIPGKMMSHKNIDVAIKILSELKKIYPLPKLVISARAFHHNNNDEYVSRIYTMIRELKLEDNVMNIQDELGDLPAGDFEVVKDLYRICDVVFFLSSYENFGLPILEAGITKAPIICNDLEVFHEISNDNIFFTNISQPPEEIAQFVSQVLKQNKSSSLFQEIKKKYSFESIFQKQILPLVDRLMD